MQRKYAEEQDNQICTSRAVKSENSFFMALFSTGYSSVRSRSINSAGLIAMTLLP